MEQQRAHEMNSTEDCNLDRISPRILKASELDVHQTRSPSRRARGKLKHTVRSWGKNLHATQKGINCHTPLSTWSHIKWKQEQDFRMSQCYSHTWWYVCDGDISTITSRVVWNLTFFFLGMNVVFRIYIWKDDPFRGCYNFGIWYRGQTSCEEYCRPKDWNGQGVTQKMALIICDNR